MNRGKPTIVDVAAITSLGQSWPETWQALRAGRHAIGPFPIRPFPYDPLVPVSAVPALVRDVAEDGKGSSARLLHSVLAQLETTLGANVGVYGGSNHAEAELPVIWAGGSETVGAADVFLRDSVPGSLGARYHTWAFSACTSSLHALNLAVMDLADGACDEALVVGCDSLSSLGVAGFWRCGATTKAECTPFGTKRDGLLVGEGAVALHLSSRKPAGGISVLGIGMSCDASHPTDPDPSGTWLEASIRSALERAGIRPDDVGAIVSHGTGTRKNDHVESEVYRRIFCASIPVTSIKGSLGHTMGAAGLLNVAVARQAILEGRLPPTMAPGSLSEPLEVIRGTERNIPSNLPLLAVASGFGGNNVACVVGVP